jgi:hypothetical protein
MKIKFVFSLPTKLIDFISKIGGWFVLSNPSRFIRLVYTSIAVLLLHGIKDGSLFFLNKFLFKL